MSAVRAAVKDQQGGSLGLAGGGPWQNSANWTDGGPVVAPTAIPPYYPQCIPPRTHACANEPSAPGHVPVGAGRRSSSSLPFSRSGSEFELGAIGPPNLQKRPSRPPASRSTCALPTKG